MATRIFVHCKSHEMPGPHKEKNAIMANMACQAVWGRDYDISKGDRLITYGGYFLYNQRCWVIIDNGLPDSLEYTTQQFKWDPTGHNLVSVPGPLHPRILEEFRNRYHFNPARRPNNIGLTDEEYEEKYGSSKLEELVKARNEKREIARRFNPPQPTA